LEDFAAGRSSFDQQLLYRENPGDEDGQSNEDLSIDLIEVIQGLPPGSEDQN
jgi:hypothetical protein